jgi:hypothetical protein
MFLRLLLFTVLLCCSASFAAEPKLVTVRPADTGEALENPAMGWVFHHFDNSIRGYGPPLGPSYAGEGWPGLTVGYLRLAWSYLEPEDGVFDWTLVDTAAQRYIRAGRKIAFRFTCFESGIPYATPEWLKDAGVGGRWFQYGTGVVPGPEVPGATWEPDYDDPLFLKRLDRFLAAAAARYDGNPNVAFVDIGTIGIWGEGNPCTRGYSLGMYKTHIDLHAKHFKKTLLVGMDDWRPRPHFQRAGTYANCFAIRNAANLKGRTLHVRAGIWLPGAKGKHLPEGRLLPAFAAEDRRVQLGELTVGEDGTMTFKQAEFPADVPEQADFTLRVREFLARPKAGLVQVEWQIPHDLPQGAVAFCHVGDAEKDIWQNCGFGTGRNQALDYARSLGATMRDDSIIFKKGIRFSNDWMAQDFWQRVPVVLESGHYGSNDWSDGADQDYFDSIEAYHGSYISIHGPPHVMWEKHQAIIRKMSQRLGYRLQLVEASWPASAISGRKVTIRSSWRNAAVAPCYPGGHPSFTLKDADGAIRAVWSDEAVQMRDLRVAEPGQAPIAAAVATFLVPERLAEGEYTLFVSVGDRDGTPRIALPLPDSDGERHYRLGTIQIQVDAEYRLRWQAPIRVEGEWRLPITFETAKPLPEKVVPFGHLDLDSRIVKGVHCTLDKDAEALRELGKHHGFLRLDPPEDANGKTYDLYLGLWVFKGRRILPGSGTSDSRVHLGTLTFADDGTPALRE